MLKTFFSPPAARIFAAFFILKTLWTNCGINTALFTHVDDVEKWMLTFKNFVEKFWGKIQGKYDVGADIIRPFWFYEFPCFV